MTNTVRVLLSVLVSEIASVEAITNKQRSMCCALLLKCYCHSCDAELRPGLRLAEELMWPINTTKGRKLKSSLECFHHIRKKKKKYNPKVLQPIAHMHMSDSPLKSPENDMVMCNIHMAPVCNMAKVSGSGNASLHLHKSPVCCFSRGESSAAGFIWPAFCRQPEIMLKTSVRRNVQPLL